MEEVVLRLRNVILFKEVTATRVFPLYIASELLTRSYFTTLKKRARFV